MSRRRIRISGSGHVRIDRGRRSTGQDTLAPRDRPANRRVTSSTSDPGSDRGVSLGADIIERAEIITEGVFRPGVADVEIKYVLSGTRYSRVDRLHTLASDNIISEATPVSVSTNVTQMIEFVKRSGAGGAGLIVDLHTHPSPGIALPSETDMNTWRTMAQLLAEEFPSARFLFGVHAVGSQSPTFLDRTPPTKRNVNSLAWRSNTRDHEIALFDPDSAPVEVQFVG